MDTTRRRPTLEDPARLVGLHHLIRRTMRSFGEADRTTVDAVFDAALSEVGEFCQVDRAYAFSFDADGEHLSNTHEWCAPGISPEIDNLQSVPAEAAGPWLEAFDQDQHVYVAEVASLPEDQADLQEILAAQDIQSLLVVPLRAGGTLYGFIGFDYVTHPSDFSEADLDILRIFADSMAATISRIDAEERIRRVELVDPLTGLPNRSMFSGLLDQSVSSGGRGPFVRSVVGLIDVDHFAQINEGLGFESGDELLLAVAERLRRSMRGEDLLARVGGDEFAVLVDATDGGSSLEAVSGWLVAAFGEPLEVGGQVLTVTASMGLAVDDGSFEHGEDLMSAAEAALREAKSMGGARAVALDKDNGRRLADRVNLAIRLRSAEGVDRIGVVYQPAVELATGAVRGAEVLARWNDQDGNPASPELFVAIAEESGLIAALTDRVVEQVLADLDGPLDGLFDGPFALSVNLSAYHLSQAACLSDLARLLAAVGAVDHVQLWAELTESSAMVGDSQMDQSLRGLHDGGIALAIDDFGTGYSSFSRLRHLPIDGIKVDRSFVSGIDGDPVNQALVRAQVGIARELDLLLLAEGVETDGERQTLVELGVEYGQGFGLHRPMPVDQLVALLS